MNGASPICLTVYLLHPPYLCLCSLRYFYLDCYHHWSTYINHKNRENHWNNNCCIWIIFQKFLLKWYNQMLLCSYYLSFIMTIRRTRILIPYEFHKSACTLKSYIFHYPGPARLAAVLSCSGSSFGNGKKNYSKFAFHYNHIKET